MATNTPLTGINKSLTLHNQKLDEVITIFLNYDPTAMRSIKELSDKFSELYSQLFSEIAKLQDKVINETNLAATASSAGNAGIAAKVLLVVKKYYDYIKEAMQLIALISKIVVKYVSIITLITLRIAETVAMGIGLGIKNGISEASNYLSSLTGVLTDLINTVKKKAVDYAKKSARETLINKWIKERDTLTSSITSPNIVSQAVKEDTLLKIDLINRNIRQANKDLA